MSAPVGRSPASLFDELPTIDVGLRRDDLRPAPWPSERLAEVVADRVRRGLREHERTRSSQRLHAVRPGDGLAAREGG